ncbi:MAG: ATP-binding protein [Gammaproteobacteria bacterium]
MHTLLAASIAIVSAAGISAAPAHPTQPSIGAGADDGDVPETPGRRPIPAPYPPERTPEYQFVRAPINYDKTSLSVAIQRVDFSSTDPSRHATGAGDYYIVTPAIIQHRSLVEFYARYAGTRYANSPCRTVQSRRNKPTGRAALALQAMPIDHLSTHPYGYTGWTAGVEYGPMLRRRGNPHLLQNTNESPTSSVVVLFQYRFWQTAGVGILLLMAGIAAHMSRLNYRLKLSKRALEIEIVDRVRAEQALRRSEHTLRRLHAITSKHKLSLDKKVQALLSMGRKLFGLPIGVLSHVEGENYEIVNVVPADGPIAKGHVFPLGQTYCCVTLQSSGPVGFEHAAAAEWRTHPAYLQHKLEAYLGIRVDVQDRPYGTLSFISPVPRTVLFTNSDKEILKLIAQWIGSEIERERSGALMRKLSGALEQTADAVMIVNREGLIEFINPAFERMTGYSRDEAIGRNPRILYSGRHGEQFYRRLWGTILRGEVFHDTFINRRRDGRLYYDEKTITPIKDEREAITHFVSTSKDATERMQTEERARQRQMELAHTQRVSAIGAMATSLAHELNQPLASIFNYAKGCIHRLDGGDVSAAELMPALEQIAAEANRSGEIIRRIREYLRRGKPLCAQVDINQIVREAADLAVPEARHKDIALRLELTDSLPAVLADAIQIEQVVLNLVRNAIEAIDAAQSPRREVIVCTRLDPAKGAEVTVADTGSGLPDNDLDHLFEPFFSTRANGMGMGLSISRSIIEAHGGRLQAHSNIEGGATFRFSLPILKGGMQS